MEQSQIHELSTGVDQLLDLLSALDESLMSTSRTRLPDIDEDGRSAAPAQTKCGFSFGGTSQSVMPIIQDVVHTGLPLVAGVANLGLDIGRGIVNSVFGPPKNQQNGYNYPKKGPTCPPNQQNQNTQCPQYYPQGQWGPSPGRYGYPYPQQGPTCPPDQQNQNTQSPQYYPPYIPQGAVCPPNGQPPSTQYPPYYSQGQWGPPNATANSNTYWGDANATANATGGPGTATSNATTQYGNATSEAIAGSSPMLTRSGMLPDTCERKVPQSFIPQRIGVVIPHKGRRQPQNPQDCQYYQEPCGPAPERYDSCEEINPPYNPQGAVCPPNGQPPSTQYPPYYSQGQWGPPNATANSNTYWGNANATANATGGPGTAISNATTQYGNATSEAIAGSSPMPTKMDFSSFSKSTITDLFGDSIDSHPVIQKGYQAIHKVLEDIEGCIHDILQKLGV